MASVECWVGVSDQLREGSSSMPPERLQLFRARISRRRRIARSTDGDLGERQHPFHLTLHDRVLVASHCAGLRRHLLLDVLVQLLQADSSRCGRR
jgi:hypothetical protein